MHRLSTPIPLLTVIFLCFSIPIISTSQSPTQLFEFSDVAAGGNYWATPTEVGGKVFYQYISSGATSYLYVTDGTTGGSMSLQTFNGDLSQPHTINGNQYLFIADSDGDNKSEIWTSDGSSGGTIQLIELSQASGSVVPYELNGKVFYRQNISGSSGHLYVTDGTVGGSLHLKSFNDITEDPHSIHGTQFLFWTDDDGDFIPEIWSSDGTVAGTQQLFEASSYPAVGPPGGTELGGLVYYCYLNDSQYGELYVTDGTAGGSTLVGSGYDAFMHPHVVGGKFMFCTDADLDIYGEIWTSDGTASGTTMLFESNGVYYSGPPTPVMILDDRAFYQYTLNGFDYQLISSDGTAGGTNLLKTFDEAFIIDHTINDNQYLFFADDNTNNKIELWTSDGTVGGTNSLLEFSDVGSWATHHEEDGKVYYHYENDAGNTSYLYTTDGTAGGTSLAKTSSNEFQLHHGVHGWSHRYLFDADDDGDQKQEIWTSDGSSAGTQQLFEFGTSVSSGYAPIAVEVNGVVYYQYNYNAGTTAYLYKTDGSVSGSSMLGSFTGKTNVPHSIHGDQYLFIADDDQDGKQEVWSVSGLVGIAQKREEQAAVKAFPNPTSGDVTITSEGVSTAFNYSIIDLSGKIVGSGILQPTSANTITLKGLERGVYVIRFHGNDLNEQVQIIKQ